MSDKADELQADKLSILFDTGTLDPLKKKWILNYIANRADILQARPPKSILQSPPAFVHKLAECVSDIIDNPEYYPEANVAVLKLSTPLEWAAELYSQMTDSSRALCARTKAPKDMAEYAVEKLSESFTVYLVFIDGKLYPGSGTQVVNKSANGGRRRQLDRSLGRKPEGALHLAIHAAHKKGLEPAQWVQAVNIRVPKLVDGQWTLVRTTEVDDMGDLLHYRVLVKLGEQSFGCLLGRNKMLRRFDRLLWPVPWKPLGPWPAFRENIKGVVTREARNARKRKEFAPPEVYERRLASNRRRIRTDEERERTKISQRVENLSDEQHEKKKARARVENMTNEQHEKQLARDRIPNMTKEKHEKKKASQRVENLSDKQHRNRKASQRVENLTDRQRELKNARNLRARLKMKAKKLALAEKTRSEMNEENAAGS